MTATIQDDQQADQVKKWSILGLALSAAILSGASLFATDLSKAWSLRPLWLQFAGFCVA